MHCLADEITIAMGNAFFQRVTAYSFFKPNIMSSIWQQNQNLNHLYMPGLYKQASNLILADFVSYTAKTDF